MVQSAGSGVKLGDTVVLLREPGYWQVLPDGSGYYLVMTNGTRITIKDPFSVPDNQRIVTINGATYLVGMAKPILPGYLSRTNSLNSHQTVQDNGTITSKVTSTQT